MTPEKLFANWLAYLELCALEVQRIAEDVAEMLAPKGSDHRSP